MTRYFIGLAHEQFPPEDVLRQAVEAERAGFDGICCSDHFQPWWIPGHSAHAWVWLGAAAQATERVNVGTAVTPPGRRYHPALIAQAFATLERLCPGRAFAGIGSGESLNETPVGGEWPDRDEQLEMLEEALETMRRLFAGETVTRDGHFPTNEAVLHTRPDRPPPLYVSAFYEGAARLAGRLGDGLWTLADPEQAPPLIDAYRDEAGDGAGEVLLQVSFSWAESDDAAFDGAKVWKAAMVDEYYTDDWHDPQRMQEHAQATVTDDEFRETFILGPDPDLHVERIRQIEELGATTVVLMNVSGADPHGAIRFYGERVLPQLR
jgi:coenzyme F420-dependent glucose-6-phosphate dehydrogenase